jgi:NAD(P)-dependent dehydrogenase (short-subunit alcohol dehydrogenase family)
VINTINIFLPLLKKGKTKKVITLSTGLADLDLTINSEFVTSAPYSISKAAVNMVNAKYAAQYKPEGFVFLAISPGLVDTTGTRLRMFSQWSFKSVAYINLATPNELQQLTAMIRKFRKLYPDFRGPITPETSVQMQLEVINRVTIDDSGAFISHKGNKEWL